jgi:hypothetical protein
MKLQQGLLFLLTFLCLEGARAQISSQQEHINQSIWLLNSNNQIISALDSSVDRLFFTTKHVSLNCLNQFPADAEYVLAVFAKDTHNRVPTMWIRYTSPILPNNVINQIKGAPSNARILISVNGNKVDGTFQFVGNLWFEMSGEPIVSQSKKPIKQEIWLQNNKRKKVFTTDTLVSRSFFEQKKVELISNTQFGEMPYVTVLTQMPDGEWHTLYGKNTELLKEMKAAILKGDLGNTVMILYQQKADNGALSGQTLFNFKLNE